MKTVIFSLLFLMTINAQNIWYINRNATGNNNGTNWTNAWTSPSNINWNNISAGDTIYISGGSDSTTYVPPSSSGFIIGNISNASPRWTFASGSPVVITKAWHSGHNGDVWFAAVDPGHINIMRVGNISNLKITGLNFIDRRASGGNGAFIQLGNADWGNVDSLIYFENCYLQSNGLNGFFYLSSAEVTVRNNYMEQIENSSPNDNDPIGVSSGRGGHIIDGNIIIMRNDNEFTDAHRDGIQISNLGDNTREPRFTTIISNNLIIDTREGGVSWNNMIYNYNGLGGGDNNHRLIIYNNVIVNRKNNTSVGGIAVGRASRDYSISLYILNNTIITKGTSGTPITNWGLDTLVIKNNLVISDINPSNMLNLDDATSFAAQYNDINYNYYAKLGGNSGNIATAGVTRTWSQWQSDGFDLNSFFENSTGVSFDNKYGVQIEDYYTETGRGQGANLSNDYPFLSYDILGNPRTGVWDMGALQFQGATSNYINLQGKVFLQGAFNSNSMTTFLSQSSLLPAAQPYNNAPWNYSGNEVLSSSSGIVDWVLVELRSSNNPSQVVARRAAVLKNDGTLLDTDGGTGVRFNNVQDGAYYIVVKHRNHLAVMSANPVQLSSNSVLYDFTDAMNKAFGNNPMADLGSGGSFGMYSGDGNGDGGINIFDKNVIWQSQNGTMGYLGGDFDLDGGVTANDVNLHWNINNGTMTQVP